MANAGDGDKSKGDNKACIIWHKLEGIEVDVPFIQIQDCLLRPWMLVTTD